MNAKQERIKRVYPLLTGNDNRFLRVFSLFEHVSLSRHEHGETENGQKLRIAAYTKDTPRTFFRGCTVHFVFLDASESSDRSTMSCSSFVINYRSFTVYATVFFLHLLPCSRIRPQNVYMRLVFQWLQSGCSVLNLTYASANISVDSQTSRSIA